MFIPSHNKQQDWRDFTLILPTVSVGNVGQLTADLIVSTLHMERVGYVLHPSLLPVIGSDPYADDESTPYKLTTSCEVFESKVAKVVVVQTRAPIIKGQRKIYADWLSDWIKKQHFRQVIVLTSTFAQDRLDYQISGPPFRILLSPTMEQREGEFFTTKMEWTKLELRQPNQAYTHIQDGLPGSDYLHMPGSGIAKLIFESCQELPTLVLMMFVSEGDNVHDAIALADQINKWLSLLPNQNSHDKEEYQGQLKRTSVGWKIPKSWRLVFGSKYEPKLFQ
ncbi:hypothetical protein BsWGS_22395 [Bradybaena similaris]